LALRVGLHDYVSRYLSLTQTAGAFFILAFGMIVPWRISMWVQYRKLRDGLNQSTPPYPLTEN
jgi:membrane protein CcdC involved in cytochrome C biogenesis